MDKKKNKLSSDEKLYTFGYFPESAIQKGEYTRGFHFRSGVWATSRRSAVAKFKKLKLRGSYLLNREPVVRRPYKLSSALMEIAFKDRTDLKSHIDAIHSLTFEVYLAIKSGMVSVDWALGDVGLLHEFTHAIYSKEWSNSFSLEKNLVITCLRMELEIPGLLNSKERETHAKKINSMETAIQQATSYS